MVNHATQGKTPNRHITVHVMQEAEPVLGGTTTIRTDVDVEVVGELPQDMMDKLMPGSTPHTHGEEKFERGMAVLLDECGYDPEQFGDFVRGQVDTVRMPDPNSEVEYVITATYHETVEDGANVGMTEDPGGGVTTTAGPIPTLNSTGECAGCGDAVRRTDDFIEDVDDDVYCTIDCYNEVNT